MNKVSKVILLTLLILAVRAQDIHFSQMDRVTFFFIPAQVGFMKDKYRFSTNVKSQWSSVTVPFNEYLLSAEVNFKPYLRSKGKMGAGLSLMYERAGDSKLQTLSVGPAFSYFFPVGLLNRSYVSFGLSTEWNRKSFSYEALLFDNQFNGWYADPTLPQGENFEYTAFSYLTFNVGGSFLHYFSKEEFIQSGVGVKNLNMPRVSWFNVDDVKLRPRYTFSFLLQKQSLYGFYLRSFLYVSLQSMQREWLPGVQLVWLGSTEQVAYRAMSTGLLWRVGDGVVWTGYYDFNQYRFGISYDVNLSKLRKASHGRGGFEVSFIYLFNPHQAKPHQIVCPIF